MTSLNAGTFWHMDIGNVITIGLVLLAWAYTAGSMGQRLNSIEDWRKDTAVLLKETSEAVTRLTTLEEERSADRREDRRDEARREEGRRDDTRRIR